MYFEYTRHSGIYQVFRNIPGILEYTRYTGIYQVYWVPREEPTEDGLTSSYATILDPLGYNIPGPDTEVHIRYFGEGTPPPLSVKLIKYVYRALKRSQLFSVQNAFYRYSEFNYKA